MPPRSSRAVTTALLTIASLFAFAANSLLCRMALGSHRIDPATFTSVRLISGAIVLWAIVAWRGATLVLKPRAWWSALALFVYALCFSIAYISLTAGTGALILFGAVQVTMIGAGLFRGERLRFMQWFGLALALCGLVYLLSPGLAAPSPFGATMIVGAGVAWGVYSLVGRGAVDAVGETAANFVCAVPLTVLASLIWISHFDASAAGLSIAVFSGAVTSALGYIIWYTALPRLSRTTASIAQLSVPPVAALVGTLALGEPIGTRLVIGTATILGGVALAVLVPKASR